MALLALLFVACHEREMGWPRPGFAPNVEYGPQVACAEPDSLRIAWRTLAPVEGAVDVREVGAAAWRRVTARVEAARVHDIRIDGLRPFGAYEYRLVHDRRPVGASHRIRPASPDRVTFAVLGDSGSGGPEQAAITRGIAAADPELVLHTGDLAYDWGTRRETLRRFFVPFAELLATRPWYVAWGNHDVMTDDGKPARAMIRLPGPHYYSFDRAGIRFYALDTNIDFRPGSRQYEWFVADLAESPSRRRVAFFHHAPYTGSPYAQTYVDLTNDIRTHLCPLFDRYGFDLVFNGHMHGYERAEPEDRRPVYIVTGGGGKRLNERGQAPWTRAAFKTWHFCVVTFEGGRFSLQAIDADGTVIDRWESPRGS